MDISHFSDVNVLGTDFCFANKTVKVVRAMQTVGQNCSLMQTGRW